MTDNVFDITNFEEKDYNYVRDYLNNRDDLIQHATKNCLTYILNGSTHGILLDRFGPNYEYGRVSITKNFPTEKIKKDLTKLIRHPINLN